MSKAETRWLILMMQQQFYEDKRYHFLALGNEGQYTESQKHFAFELIIGELVSAWRNIVEIEMKLRYYVT